METADFISLISILIAAGAFLYTYFVDRRVKAQEIALNDIQIKKHREEEAESKKAVIEANIYKSGKSSWKMKVYNKGKSSARNIRFISDDIEKENSGIEIYTPNGTLPYPLLHPQTSFELSVVLYMGHNPVPKVKFIWDDDYGENQEREQILNI